MNFFWQGKYNFVTLSIENENCSQFSIHQYSVYFIQTAAQTTEASGVQSVKICTSWSESKHSLYAHYVPDVKISDMGLCGTNLRMINFIISKGKIVHHHNT